MIVRTLHRLCSLHKFTWHGRLLFQYHPLPYLTFAVAQDLHTQNFLGNAEKVANWVIQRNKKVRKFKSPESMKIAKELPIWQLKMHQFLMSDVDLPPCHLKDQAIHQFMPFSSMTTDNLIAEVWSVSQYDIKALTSEITKRMDSMSLEQIIVVADIFCLNQLWVPSYCQTMITFVTEMFELLEFTPSQLTRLAFHFMCQGGASPDFVIALEKKTWELINDLTLNETAVICHSFFSCQTRIKSMKLLDDISVKLLRDIDSMNFWYLTMFMKTFRYSNFIKISFYHDLGDLIIQKDFLKQFGSLAQVMHVAFAYASSRITHPNLFSYLLHTCIHSPGYKFRLKDVSKLIWACGTLLVNQPEDLKIIQQISEIAKDYLSEHETKEFPDNIVDLCIGLCFLNVYSDFFINKIFSEECIPTLMGLGLDRERFYQLNFLHQCIEIEHPHYVGNLPDKKTKELILSKIGEFSLELEFSQKKGLWQAFSVLQVAIGADKVICKRVLPHFHSSDLVLVWDKFKSCFVKEIAESFAEKHFEDDERFIKLAIVVTSLMQTTYDGKLLGLLHTRLRQLKILGYHVIQINPEEAYSFVHLHREDTQNLLMEKIASALEFHNENINS